MNTLRHLPLSMVVLSFACFSGNGQEYGQPDRGEPGDAMIQGYLAAQADAMHASFDADLQSLEDWQNKLPRYRREYMHMLGLWPVPEKTPLHATVTGSLNGEGYAVDMIHFQSRPGLYVTGNLYRPARAPSGERLPAVLYVCGHSYQGRSGNKTAYQSHGIWFARHGYVCLVIDSLQLGEIAALHHGTYRENRWSWHSRGYTPAGVECWNGVRAIDYLTSRPDVDPTRLAVTGISGGGAATFWIAAADERARVAVPVSGMADLPSYINNRVINGHCDCMFLYNTFRWPWTRIASLIAPRSQLFVNSDEDPIFPMDANERVINRLERVYSLYGRSDHVDAVVSIGGHAYRQDIRQAAYRFINLNLKNDARTVRDGEEDLITGERDNQVYPIAIDRLRVFPKDEDIPSDELNTTIDEHFVPLAEVAVPEPGDFGSWKSSLLNELRRVTFGSFPDRIPPARARDERQADGAQRLETEPGIEIPLRAIKPILDPGQVKRVLLGISHGSDKDSLRILLEQHARDGDARFVCEPRGVGATRWTEKNPPNYVRRSHLLLGQTEDTGRVRDVIAVARFLKEQHGEETSVVLIGEGGAAMWAAYAALWEEEIDSVVLAHPPASHLENTAPQFLNVLRVCDVPEVLGMVAPRGVTLEVEEGGAWSKTAAISKAGGGEFEIRSRR
jgi:dienelactone hydrolase